MQLAYVLTDNTAVNASWTLTSIAKSNGEAYIYTFGPVGSGATSGLSLYASVALTSFSIANLSTVAISIA